MGTINDRIERVNRPKETDENEKRGKTGYREIDNMADKLGLLERGEKGLHRELDAIQAEMEGLSSRMKKSAVGCSSALPFYGDADGDRRIISRCCKASSNRLQGSKRPLRPGDLNHQER